VLCAIVIILTALLAVAALGGGYLARHRAAAAADLAALAAAEQLRVDAASACAEARTVAEVNGGLLRSCEVDGSHVEVAVAAEVIGPTRWLADPVRHARAGPDGGVVAGGDDGDGLPLVAGWGLPIEGDYRVTARFGDSGPAWSSGSHTGLDFAAPAGTPVLASAGGRVREAGPAGPYGNLVAVDHGGVITYYAHLFRIVVGPGELVRTGQQVGSVGSTGNATGPHLHFEVRVAGVPRDPAAFLSAHIGAG
jgi:secretion/DNA translocation related TadE-like protein